MPRRRHVPKPATPPSAVIPNEDELVKAVARPNVPSRARTSTRSKAPTSSSSQSSFWSTWLPNAIVISVAYAAVVYGFTTSPEYVHSKELLTLLKKAFIALVCISSRSLLSDFFVPPNKNKTLMLLVWGHARALLVAILANCAGTSVINPIFGLAPQYVETVEMVIPTYVLVEIVLALPFIPKSLVQLVIGFLVGWLKAVTTSKLVAQWQADAGAHPVAFVLVCTSNLYASGFVLRFVAHYHHSGRVFDPSIGLIWSLAKAFVTSAFIGLIAHIANHFGTQEERQVEAFVLYFLVAWFALDRYWKGPLSAVLAPANAAKAKKA